MSCINNNKGINRECIDSIGGIDTIVLYPHSTGNTYLDVEQLIDTMVLEASIEPYIYDTLRWTSNYADPIVGGQNLTAYWTPQINMTFKKNEASIVNEIYNISRGYMSGIIKDQNGKYFAFGLTNGLEIQGSGGSTSGSALGEQNQLVVLLQGMEKKPMYEVDMEAVGIDAKLKAIFGIV